MGTNAQVWSQQDDMSAFEAVMWRAESDPRLRSTMFAIEILDTVPDWDRLFDAHEWATRLVRRFRQRVVTPPFGLGTPVWRFDPEFDLHYHLRRTRLPEPGTWEDLLRTVEQIAMTPFDRERSPWEAVLVEGLEGGKAAYVLKLHHATTDGMGAVQLFQGVHSSRRAPTKDKVRPDVPAARSTPGAGLLASQVARDTKAVAATARRTLGTVAKGFTRPVSSVRESTGYAGSLKRVLADPDTSGSPLLAGRSLARRLMAMDVRFADLRAAGRVAGGSLNDAYLAALLGSFARYHEAKGQTQATIPLGVPISVRKEGDEQGGNKFAGARLAAPMDIADPVERMQAIGGLIRAARDEVALDALSVLSPAMARLPSPIIAKMAGNMTKLNDIQASNVPGMREDAYVAGALVERVYGYAPAPGCACMAVLVSHGDLCCLAANIDPAAITDLETFGECLVAGFDEVLALAPDHEAPVLHTS